MKYQKPEIMVVAFEENENVLVSATSYGLVDGSGWFVPLS